MELKNDIFLEEKIINYLLYINEPLSLQEIKKHFLEINEIEFILNKLVKDGKM